MVVRRCWVCSVRWCSEKKDERVIAFILLVIVALFVAFIPPRQDRQANADVDTLVFAADYAGPSEAEVHDRPPPLGLCCLEFGDHI